ncbi:CASP-like protein 4D1 [Hibiscus syriacus]|uniref:CASP-like protein 4D1 n=1 Tax=Hibiscus syriacus TaxID=106335 RepID=UPI0019232A1D|nr:CASP-like protein 4D1 [Hibiscus syriacus]
MASKKAAVIVSLVLRICTLFFAAGCIVVLILDKATDDDGSKVTFKDVISMWWSRLLLYRACTGKRLIRGPFLPTLYFHGDKVVAFVLASSVGAGFLTTAELKRFINDLLESFGARLKDTPFEGFFNRGYLATALLAAAFLCMAILSIFSAPAGNKAAGNKGFFFR